MNNECQVSILCATYNQKSYIGQALDSLLMQETSFSYEILLHDDASKDGTTDIVKEYADRYPEKIRLFLEQENKFQRNINFWAEIFREHNPAKYIAINEGDDFWTDPHKLQKQVDAMEVHSECDTCACCAAMVSEDGILEIGQIRPRIGNGILSMEETILGGGMYLATNTLLFRREILLQPMRFQIIRSLDYADQMRGALRGGIVYIDEKMATYRRFAKNSWTNILVGTNGMVALQCEQEKEILRTLDEETGGKYHDTIVQRLKAYDVSFYSQLVDHREELLALINDCSGKRYMWGCGIRGMAFEQFCQEERITLDGVCDVTDVNIGRKTVSGNLICRSEDVLNEADVILASATRAYEGLKEKGYSGRLINLQDYMPIA